MPNLKSNHREQLVYKKYTDLGYECLTKGYPDFCFYNGDKVIFVEVKKKEQMYTMKKGLAKHQQKMINIFKGLGLDVRIEYIE